PLLLSEAVRAELGAFYTPMALVSRLLDRATESGTDWKVARILDPAAGGGAFLLQAALRMRAALSDCEPAFVAAQIGARLVGFEIDPCAAAIAQFALDIALADLTEPVGRSPPQILRVVDALKHPPEESFDLVVGNPPYGRVSLTPTQRNRFA